MTKQHNFSPQTPHFESNLYIFSKYMVFILCINNYRLLFDDILIIINIMMDIIINKFLILNIIYE